MMAKNQFKTKIRKSSKSSPANTQVYKTLFFDIAQKRFRFAKAQRLYQMEQRLDVLGIFW
jgi:hypothetical protein